MADLSLDREMLKAVIENNGMELVERREEVRRLYAHIFSDAPVPLQAVGFGGIELAVCEPEER